MPDAKIENINGHNVRLGNEDYNYSKYLVLCDSNYTW